MKSLQKYSAFIVGLILLILTETVCAFAESIPNLLPITSAPRVIDFFPLTTHPDIDLAGTVSPDGRWLAYTSKSSGNFDIWIRSIAGGEAHQITVHKADDYSPAWSPDGKRLAFSSVREDACGDIWVIDLDVRRNGIFPTDRLQKITTYLGFDDFAKFAPHGERLAFVSDRDGQENIWTIDLKKKQYLQITRVGGTHPAWSADGRWLAFTSFRHSTRSHLFITRFSTGNLVSALPPVEAAATYQITNGNVWDGFPCWSPQGHALVFARIGLDTNFDGILTPADPAALWKIDVASLVLLSLPVTDSLLNEVTLNLPEFQITPWDRNRTFPLWAADQQIYFTQFGTGNPDIFRVPANGIFPKNNSGAEQLAAARAQFPFPAPGEPYPKIHAPSDSLNPLFTLAPPPEFLFNRLLALQRVIDFFPRESETIAWTHYEIGRTLQALGFATEGTEYFNRFLNEFSAYRETAAFAEIERVESRAAEFGSDFLAQRVLDFQADIDLYSHILEKYRQYPRVTLRIEIIMTDILANAGERARALEQYEAIIQNYSDFPQECAEVQWKIGNLFAKFDQGEAVTRAFLKVITNFPEQQKWVDQALKRIFTFEDTLRKSSDLILAYKDFGASFQNIPLVAATAQLKIGQILFKIENFQNALEELNQILTDYSGLTQIVAQARLLMAQIYIEQGDDLKGIQSYENIIQDYSQYADGIYAAQARSQLMAMLLESGERLWKLREFNHALIRFAKARTIQSDNITAHRGVIKCLYWMGRLNEGIQYYQAASTKNPALEIYTYCLGLCYAYKATEKAERFGKAGFDIEYLKTSNAILEKTLAQNYRLIEAYLTLGVNYELMERAETFEREKPRAWYARTLNSMLAPAATVYRLIFRIKEKRPERWFEKAIDVLTTAIALNDETQDPQTEVLLALNLANNYYNLQEFGYKMAYQYYREVIAFDSTFQNPEVTAQIYARIGHCALVVEDFKNGPAYLKGAIRRYEELGRPPQVVLNIKRLALLYQLAGEYPLAIDYLQKAAAIQKTRNLPPDLVAADLALLNRQIAYNFNYLEDEDEVQNYTAQALDALESSHFKKVKSEANWLKIGILGWQFPVYNAGKVVTGRSTAYAGFTTEEEYALLWSLRENSAERQKDFQRAIDYHQQKLAIYKKLDNPQAQAIILNNIGFLQYLKGDFQNAWQYFKTSLNLCDKNSYFNGALINIFNLASLTLEINRPTENVLFPTAPAPGSDFGSVSTAIQFIHLGLDYYHNEEIILDPRHKFTLLNALGNLYLTQAWQRYQPAGTTSILQRPQDWIGFLEQISMADSCFKLIFKIAPEAEYPLENALIRLNRGIIFQSIGEFDQAYVEARRSYDLAQHYNYPGVLWRAAHFLANLLRHFNLPDRNREELVIAPELYYNEALELVQSNVLVNQIGAIPMFQAQAIRPLYEDAITYYTEINDSETALYLAECLRAQIFLGTTTHKRINLKTAYDQNFWSHAYFYQSEIKNIENEIRKVQFSITRADTIKRRNLQIKLTDTQKEYLELLNQIKYREPELESMIRVNPPAFQTVQRIIPADAAAVQYLTTDSQLLIWVLTPAEVHFQSLPIKRSSLQKMTFALLNSLSNDDQTQNIDVLADSLNYWLLKPIWPEIQNKAEVIFIPDDGLHLLPFNLLSYYQNGAAIKQIATIAPSLANYYYCFMKRKISGERIFLSAVDDSLIQQIQNSGYTRNLVTVSEVISKDLQRQLSQSSVIHLQLQSDWNEIDPALSQFTSPPNGKFAQNFTGLQLLSWNLKSNLVILDYAAPLAALTTFPSVFTYLQHALFYGGTPSLLSSLWPVTPALATEFYHHFYQNLSYFRPALALLKTQQLMAQKYPQQHAWAGYQLYGFGGMSKLQEQQFAQESFAHRVVLGNSAFEDKSWDEAISYYEDAIQMARARNDHASLPNLYDLIVQVAFKGGNYPVAIEYQEKLLTRALDSLDLNQMINGYYNLMIFYAEHKDYAAAVRNHQAFVSLAEQYGLNEAAAESFLKLGKIYDKAGDYARAIQTNESALERFKALGNTIKVAETQLNSGAIYLLKLRDYSRALRLQSDALAQFKAEGDDQNLVRAYQELGVTYEYLANFQESRQSQEAALAIARDQADSLNIGISLYNLANVFWKTGDYQNTLKNLSAAIALFNRFSYTQLHSVALSTQGLVYMTLGQLDDALKAEEQAKQLAETTGIKSDLSAIYKNIGLIYKQMRQWQLALDNFQHALTLDQALNDVQGLANAHRTIGMIYSQQRRLPQARQQLLTGLRYAEQIKDGRNETYILFELAQVYYAQDQVDSCLVLVNQALQKAEFLMLPEIAWRAERFSGKIYEQRGDANSSLVHLRNAESIIESMRARINVDDYKAGFIDDKLEVYYDLVRLLVNTNQQEAAWEMAERSKSRNFVDLLANRDLGLQNSTTGKLSVEKDNLYQQISTLQNEVARLRIKGSLMTAPEKSDLARTEQELEQSKTSYQKVLNQLQAANPELADLVSVNPKSLPEIQLLLPDSVGLVEYYYTPTQLFCWILTRQKLNLETVTVRSDSLGQMVLALRRQMTQRLSIDEISRRLYAYLVQPVAKHLVDLKHLVIVPHGFLHYLPFAALLDAKDAYLLDKFSLSLAPSATVLAYCLQKGENFVPANTWKPQILALGNPDLGDPALNLEFAEHEIRSLSRIFSNQVEAYSGKSASESVYRARGPQSNMILFSCHGEYDAKNPLFSALLLSPDQAHDGRLEANEIFSLRLNSYLIVMSACETGLGTLTGGDEVIGLSRSFIFAGAAALMSSLWKVDDLATAVLIKRFFRNLKDGANRSEALRKAQLLVRNEINLHPAFWAAFNLTGDFR
ncbi:CHAT domain-containing protein [candidate division KSB1 bacterium]|nr:CHAT domain-containing protein [candidate division KSB1 bacterium]